MTTIYIHIGTHKTATTSLQKFLTINREKLYKKGFLYPLSGSRKKIQEKKINNGIIDHHNLVFDLLKEHNENYRQKYNQRSGDWNSLLEEIAAFSGRNVILSSEFLATCLTYNDASKIGKIKQYLKNYDVKIIVYLRRQDAYFLSIYSQAVKAAFEWDNIKNFIHRRKQLGWGDYYKLLEPWKNVFGAENIIVRPFEKSQLIQGIYYDFLKCIQLNSVYEELEIPQDVNVSPNAKQIQVICLLNKLARELFKKTPQECQKIYLHRLLNPSQKSSKIVSSIPNFILQDQLISAKEKIQLMQAFEDSNRRVAEEYLKRENGQLFESIKN
ncbi:MAG: hypothetical protein QNJ64_00105 [Crocosphaera sp.]|nr:hypothetical protein [Crocosphaera sp.]